MELTNEKKRLYKFDNLKFFLIFLVVLGHVVDIYISSKNPNTIYKKIFIFIYTFHMPLFVFLTGFFQKKLSTFREIPFKKIAWYIFLVFFMKIIGTFCGIHFNSNFSFSFWGGASYYWFLWVVSFYIIISPLIEKFKFYPLLVFSIILASFTGYDKTIGDTFYLSRIIVFFPFYLVGYKLNSKKEKLVDFCNDKWIKLDALVLLLIFIYICFSKLDIIYPLRMLFTGRNPFASIKSITCTYQTRILTYCISFITCFVVLVLAPNKKISIISKLGTRTLQVYVLHKSVLISLTGLGFFNFIGLKYANYTPIILVLFSLLLTIILSAGFIEKIFNYIKNHMFSSETT